MLYRLIWGIIFSVVITSATNAQEPNNITNLSDSLKETVIYEYDTVYLAPDTIHLTDTVINYIKPSVAPKKSQHRIFRFFSSYSIFSNFTPNSFELKVSPFVSNNVFNKELIDSSENKTGVNLSYLIQLNYNIGKFAISAGLGFTPFHETYYLKDSYNSSTFQVGSAEPYDSIFIDRSSTYTNYYNFLNFYISFGKTWNIGKKIFFNINISGHTDFLIGHNAYAIGNLTKLPASAIRSIDFSLSISPYIGYKINRTVGVFISPYYQHSLTEINKYPRNTYQKAGIGAGLKFYL